MLIRPVLSIGLRRLVLVATSKETTRSIRKNHDRPWDRSCKGEEDSLQNCAVVEPSPTLPALRSQTLPTPSSSGRPCDHHGPSQPKKNELVSYSDHRDSFDPRPNQEVPAWRHATEKAGLLELSERGKRCKNTQAPCDSARLSSALRLSSLVYDWHSDELTGSQYDGLRKASTNGSSHVEEPDVATCDV
ncbi:uncharacterized protein UMAG_03327 [Mycosarcoma maydis]|uniref:Uncharacterized protein n=1 Tax=Mycosarcoma maydis TaxID=5270 RepID=A0A0D1DYP4_MYCMD|nr:uncharacterized protein UMAG_03327 [Ustilago maydis 521]KIS68761.1 hypothetical protein UMAG_03327 [Ustilago maydis 521]|eukprot:XP_011389725.1 hypothetical protein UMAG_03327 [Ustilago maydis 521]